VKFGIRLAETRLGFLEKMNMLGKFRKVGIRADRIMGFRARAGYGKPDEIRTRLDQFRDISLVQSLPAGNEANLRAFLFNQPNAIDQVRVEERFAPTFKDHGFNIFKIGRKLLKIFQGHVLPGHIVMTLATAHLAAEGTTGGQFDLPGGKGFALRSPEELFPK